MSSAWLYGLIIGCEAAFWILLGLALVARYLLRRAALSRILLWSLPAVDALLLVFTALDLRAGTPATFAHGLATAYIGFTIAFGAPIVAWADARFAHRFAGGPVPLPAPQLGWAAVRYELALWLRSLVAWAIAVALLIGLIAMVEHTTDTAKLRAWFHIAVGSAFLWLVFGPVWRIVFFRRAAPK